MSKQPTPKQKKAAELILENIGKDKPEPIGKILQEAGYSKETSDTPQLVTKSQGFMALMDRAGVTDDKLIQKLNEGLDATKAVVMGTKSEESFVDVQPDYAVRHKYLETGLRLKGHAKVEPSTGNTFISISQGDQNALNL